MSETMNAIVRTKGGAEHVPVPRPELTSAAEVLVRVSTAGICRTDLFTAEGALPVADGRILGHELAGTVEGRRVAIVPSILRPDLAALDVMRVTHASKPLPIFPAVLWDRRRPRPRSADRFGEWLAAHYREIFPGSLPPRRESGKRKRAATG